MNADAVADLLRGLGRHTPELPDAVCRNMIPLFDSERATDITDAIAVCERCPARNPCGTWAASVDPRHLGGVVAGHLYPFNKRNPAPSAAGRTPR
ncbi:WhiB family transcriptional regulator [Mycobacterium sp. TJFP1]